MTRALVALLALAILLPLGGCGRVGPPRPPGPRERITYPRAYPAPDPVRPIPQDGVPRSGSAPAPLSQPAPR